MTFIRRLALCCLILCAPGAMAARLEIPLRVPSSLSARRSPRSWPLPRRTQRDLPRGRAVPEPRHPKLDALDGHLRLAGPGSAAFGVELLASARTPPGAARWNSRSRRSWTVPDACAFASSIPSSPMQAADGAARVHLGLEQTPRTSAPATIQLRHRRLARGVAGHLGGAAPPEHSAALNVALTQLQVLELRVETAQIVGCRSRLKFPMRG